MDMEAKPLSYISLDLAALAANLGAIRAHIRTKPLLMAVVKANAYGHGAAIIAQAALERGADWLAVNRAEEGLALRKGGISAPILVMGYSDAHQLGQCLAHDLKPTITEDWQLEALSAAGDAAKKLGLHVKVDTGMGRLGQLPQNAPAFVERLVMRGLKLEGLFTHFAVADSDKPDDVAYTRSQFAKFQEAAGVIEGAGIWIPIKHVANSAGTLYYPEYHLDMVRAGIILYGLRPNTGQASPIMLKPVLGLHSHVARLQILPKGSFISYGRTYHAENAINTALIPIGYGDGYHRLLSNRGAVLIRGQLAPIIGRVCMDQMMVDVSHIEGVKLGDAVVLIGTQGEKRLSADDIAAWAETINYEVTTALLDRLPRLILG